MIVCCRYASLFFITGVETLDNELITLEYIHHYVECLDRYFGNVCELDIIFNFHQVRSKVCYEDVTDTNLLSMHRHIIC